VFGEGSWTQFSCRGLWAVRLYGHHVSVHLQTRVMLPEPCAVVTPTLFINSEHTVSFSLPAAHVQ